MQCQDRFLSEKRNWSSERLKRCLGLSVCFLGHFSCDMAQSEEKKNILTCTMLTWHEVNGAMWPVWCYLERQLYMEWKWDCFPRMPLRGKCFTCADYWRVRINFALDLVTDNSESTLINLISFQALRQVALFLLYLFIPSLLKYYANSTRMILLRLHCRHSNMKAAMLSWPSNWFKTLFWKRNI